jgi:acyl-ACP thioesterase
VTDEPTLSLTVPYRARFDECGSDGLLRTSGFMRWAQDCAWIHSERLGFTRDWYASRGLWWLVRCAELNVTGDVHMGETAAVTTSIVGYRKVWARRRTDVAGSNGTVVASALTDWVITDQRGAPTRVPEEFFRLFGTGVRTFAPGRVVLPPRPSDAGSVASRAVEVRAADGDPMGHVNNAAYIDFLEESLAAAGHVEWPTRLPRRYRLEYVAAAPIGSTLTAETWPMAPGFAQRLLAADGSELLRATIDVDTAHEDFRQLVASRGSWLAPGKDAGAG